MRVRIAATVSLPGCGIARAIISATIGGMRSSFSGSTIQPSMRVTI
jgi:hypothetical protein